MRLRRRSFIAGAGAGVAAAALARPAIAQPASVLKSVPQANLTSIDPIWTTANITRNYGHMVYDTLYGIDQNFVAQPQMAAGHVVEEDGKRVTITLRENLLFHDGEPVRAADAAQSIRRWMERTAYGLKLKDVLDEVSAPDDKRLVLRLKKPFPMLFQGLGQVSGACFIMPERVAKTDPFKQIDDTTGSGPFVFIKSEYNTGSRMAFARNAKYQPVASGEPSLIAGPKRVFFDRVEWLIIPDAATAAAALQRGEIDWFEQPPPEIQDLLARNRDISIDLIDKLPLGAVMRLNHLHPPFNDKKTRQALLPAVVQSDYMSAVVGTDPSNYRVDVGVFTPDTPLVNNAGMEALTSPRSIDRAKALLKEAGYTNQTMRLIGPTDILAPAALTQVAADMFRRLGMNMDFALSDWGTVIQRRTSREPVEKGGWSVLCTASSSFDQADPAAHSMIRGNGLAGWPGWPTIPKLEELRNAWFDAPTLDQQRTIAAEIQRVALDEVSYIPLGCYYGKTALRKNLTGRVPGLMLSWNLRRT
jgi:peptide/nickel transport system substrate-binding protein